ncbi:hypothetical protein JCGZ_12640 [Jatropha curcas]|uniref:Aminotransferase-like plant mobile domain-containing protein n=1 Tax=Jatropha curcas TaxID=180498 RepID=A0A067KEE5_JATCU|nr:hypothetical protein JCGZ_12640 [Jatropha curcas]
MDCFGGLRRPRPPAATEAVVLLLFIPEVFSGVPDFQKIFWDQFRDPRNFSDVSSTILVYFRIPFGVRPIELYDDWRTEISPAQMIKLIGIDLPRIIEPGSVTPALSVSRRWLSLQSPGIYARYKRGELTATQVARFTLLLLFASTFWSNKKEKFNPSIVKSLENLAHLEEYDWAGAILSRMYDDMCDMSRGHCKLSGTYYFWVTWAFEYFPYTRPELIRADLDLGLAPSAWRWYRTNLQSVRHKKSLKELRAFFDACTMEQN